MFVVDLLKRVSEMFVCLCRSSEERFETVCVFVPIF